MAAPGDMGFNAFLPVLGPHLDVYIILEILSIGCLIPADDLLALRLEVLCNAVFHVTLELLEVFKAFLLHPLFAGGAGLPPVLGGLVAADMDVFAGEEGQEVVPEPLDEVEGLFLPGTEDVGENALAGADFHGRSGAGELRVGCQNRRHVAWHVDFRNDVDSPLCCIAYEVLHFGSFIIIMFFRVGTELSEVVPLPLR